MSESQKKMFLIFSYCGSIFGLYNEPLTKTASKMSRLMKKQLKNLYRSNPKEYVRMANDFNVIWDKYVNANMGVKLEGMNLIVEALSYDEGVSEKYGVTEKLLTSFACLRNDDVPVDIETHSRKLTRNLIEDGYELFGIEKVKKVNLSLLKNKIKNNLIIEGKIK